MKLLAFLLALSVSAFAATFSGDVTLSPGYSVNEPATASVLATVTLAAPGTYSARSWEIAGTLQFSTAGEYTLIATGGPLSVTSLATVRFLGVGAVTLRLAAAGAVSMQGSVRPGVTVFQLPAIPTTTETPAVTTPAPPLVNLSVRATLAAGQLVTPGFVIGGTVPRRVLVRAVGPSLTAFGIANPLTVPALAVFSANAQIAANAGWGGGAALSSVFASVGAFALPVASRDAALVLTLAPGNYTAQVGGGAGEVLVEVYFVD